MEILNGCKHRPLNEKQNYKLEAKDVLPKINRIQTAKRAEKCRFFPGHLDL